MLLVKTSIIQTPLSPNMFGKTTFYYTPLHTVLFSACHDTCLLQTDIDTLLLTTHIRQPYKNTRKIVASVCYVGKLYFLNNTL